MNKRFESIETSFLKFYFYKFFNHLTYFLYPIKLFIKYKKVNLNNVSSVCILNQWGLGDSVQCAFIVNALLKYFPNLKISVIGNSLYKPLFLKKNIKYFSYLPPWVNKKNMYIRLSKRKNLNRYDKFRDKFNEKVQKGFSKIVKKNPTKYMVVDSNRDIHSNKKLILTKINKLI